MRSLLATLLALAFTVAAAAQPPRFDPEPLIDAREFGAQADDILAAAKDTIGASPDAALLTEPQRDRAIEQITAVLDAWMSYDRDRYDALMASWGGTPRYPADSKDTAARRWTLNAWRSKDHPFAITRLDLDSFRFNMINDGAPHAATRGQPAQSKSGASVTPTFFRFEPRPTTLTLDASIPVVEFRMLVETADTETRTLSLRFVWHEEGGRWMPVVLKQFDSSAPGPRFYF